ASLRCLVFARQSRLVPTSAPARGGAVLLRPGAADLLEDRLEHREGGEDVLVGDRAGAGRAARGERLPDRAVLLGVPRIETVDRVVAGRPDGGAGEGAARALRELLDERQVGDAIDHVVESVVRAYPVAHDSPARVARLVGAQILGDLGEVLLRLFELG